MKKLILCAWLFVSVVGISGCAFGNRHPVLGYTTVVPKAEPKNIAVYVQAFKDERTDQGVIGHVRNGWGMKTAAVVTTTNVAQWVTEAFKAELSNAGYNVVDTPNSPIRLEGEVLTVYCDSFLNYEGKVTLEVMLKKNNEVLLNKKYEGNASGMNWAARAATYGAMLEKSLQQAMIQVVNDINAKLAP